MQNTIFKNGWAKKNSTKSLEESHKTVFVNGSTSSFWSKLFSFMGPGYLVAVGYMDPGNWATGLAGGSAFGYKLLFIIALSNAMAIFLQYLSIKLGVVCGRDLAQACRDHYSKPVVIALWLLAEIAIIACDLAEVIGSAVAFNLLFNIPLAVGVFLTAMNVAVIFMMQKKSFRFIEALVVLLIIVIVACFSYIIVLAKPCWIDILKGFMPTSELFYNTEMLYLSAGILGATVMPHNLYLHSAIVQTRDNKDDNQAIKEALVFAGADSFFALSLAFFVNAALLIVAASVFYTHGFYSVVELSDAYILLSPLLGTNAASIIFALALLLSGINATLTGTLAGQVVMEGFINISMNPWTRRFISRALAIVPAGIVVIMCGQGALSRLLLLSQVILSLQLPFAVIPLVVFTSTSEKMGIFVNAWATKISAFVVAGVIVFLNMWLIVQVLWAW